MGKRYPLDQQPFQQVANQEFEAESKQPEIESLEIQIG